MSSLQVQSTSSNFQKRPRPTFKKKCFWIFPNKNPRESSKPWSRGLLFSGVQNLGLYRGKKPGTITYPQPLKGTPLDSMMIYPTQLPREFGGIYVFRCVGGLVMGHHVIWRIWVNLGIVRKREKDSKWTICQKLTVVWRELTLFMAVESFQKYCAMQCVKCHDS